jgi:[acyl-carrier-protein] S-malonyltransferase
LAPTIACVFPGQGSQSPGMLADLAQGFPVVRRTFDEASNVLGFDLWALAQDGPADQLDLTTNTQPAMLAAGVATWRAWSDAGGPDAAVVAGHSLGEFSALVCAGAIDFDDAVALVADRARFMQEAVPAGQGGIAALIGLDDEAVRALCEQLADGEVLEAVNFNAPGQVAVAGHANAIDRLVASAPQAGARRAIRLPVSVPVHSSLMRPAAERFGERLASVIFHPPKIPVLHNYGLRPQSDPAGIRAALAGQLAAPVPWVATIEQMVARGVGAIVESGPGRVLTGLNRRISKDVQCLSVHDRASLETAIAAVLGGD